MRNKRGQFFSVPHFTVQFVTFGHCPSFVHITEMGSLTPLALQPARFLLIREGNRFQFFHEEGKKSDAKRNENNK